MVGLVAALGGGLIYSAQPAPEAEPLSEAEAAQRQAAIASRFEEAALLTHFAITLNQAGQGRVEAIISR